MLMPRSQQTTKVAPKQSPAPVGSTSSTANRRDMGGAVPVIVAGAVGAALDDDAADAALEERRDRLLLALSRR